MADYPRFDLFSEIDELYTYMDGKESGNFDFIDVDENVECNAGIPSHGLVDDTMLAVDSSNALLGDPLFNIFEQKELLELQSAANSHNPETFMPVSLPADSPSPPCSAAAAVDQPPPSSSTTAARSSLASSSAVSPLHTSSSDTSTTGSDSDNLIADDQTIKNGGKSVEVISSGGAISAPVRIIVKTKKQPINKMVAPLALQTPARNLVKIPKSGLSNAGVRMASRPIRAGVKVGPNSSTTNIQSVNSPAAASSSQSVRITNSKSLRIIPATTSSTSEASAASNSHPFRSLRARTVSSSSGESQPESSTGVKRKAYELDPMANPLMERCRKNAVNAKRNRDAKKAHMHELEQMVQDVSRERDQLAGENERLREAKVKLEQQVKHLNNILKNQSKLSSLIGKISPSSVIVGDMTSSGSEDEIVSSGMCLHVDGEEATIEYCSYCAKKAGKKLACE